MDYSLWIAEISGASNMGPTHFEDRAENIWMEFIKQAIYPKVGEAGQNKNSWDSFNPSVLKMLEQYQYKKFKDIIEN